MRGKIICSIYSFKGIKNGAIGHTFNKLLFGGLSMSKASKNKKNKVPRLTEAEYANYVNSLKTAGQVCEETQKEPLKTDVEQQKS